jgi:predicted transcriptional regulator
MSRPAVKERDIAQALGITVAEVPARLRALHAATKSVRDVADYLTRKGVPTSKSWLHRQLATSEEDPS